ncbi:glycosyltransferase family 9 protein [Xenorhabdus sp. TH1]|uniref:glycosyltransferase family 9 protein n=1 Tax=Xenorhabdus sp. TH1 TaxID=3130166 RepID=UPI0030CDC46F
MKKENKKFATLRAWNRKRNYLMKDIRYYIRLLIAKLIWDKRGKNIFDIDTIKTVLLLRNEGKIGDMIVDTILIRELNRSGYQVDVVGTKSNCAILKYNPYVRNIYLAEDIDVTSFMKDYSHNIPFKTLSTLKNNNYDLIVDPSLFNTPIHRLSLFKKINPKNIIGFNKKQWINHYNKTIFFDYNESHIKFTYESLMNSLGINVTDFSYDLYYPSEIDIETKKFIDNFKVNSEKIIIINPFAGNIDRCLSVYQLKRITEKLNNIYGNIKVVFLDHENIIDMSKFDGVYRYQSESLYHTISMISQADLIISPDTSIVHISAAYKKPLVAIYQDIESNKTLWGPGYDEAIQILAKNGRLQENKDIDELVIESVKKIFQP